MSARGWGYYLEGTRAIHKGEFAQAAEVINDCRKSGDLPLDICSEDDACKFDNITFIDTTTPEQEADYIIKRALEGHENYNPISFWDNQLYYVQMVVEKADLKSLFAPVCEEFHVPLANAVGWSRINTRAEMMERFSDWEDRGKECVLLWCGDHDPGGLQISNHMRSNMEEIAETVGWSPDNLVIDRFGLNYDYIQEHDLSWIDNLVTGSGVDLSNPKHKQHRFGYVRNYIAKYGVRKVEANALLANPEAGRALCRSAILKYIDEFAAGIYRDDLESRREAVLNLVRSRLKEAA